MKTSDPGHGYLSLLLRTYKELSLAQANTSGTEIIARKS